MERARTLRTMQSSTRAVTVLDREGFTVVGDHGPERQPPDPLTAPATVPTCDC